ncbi:MAG: hypothetical protein ILM98_11795 [Kiritimatiellae bacterium]|nr:hypothetical protein [Kiritimatiellia bacterium]
MPYALVEKDYECLTDAQQRAVGLFVRFLLSQGGNDLDMMPFSGFHDMTLPVAVPRQQNVEKVEFSAATQKFGQEAAEMFDFLMSQHGSREEGFVFNREEANARR